MRAALLNMRSIRKQYPGALALDEVNFDLQRGEVHCLVGENGAGKSTLMKILSGALRKDAGTIHLDGREVDLSSPQAALRLGIGTIYQDFKLAPELAVAENILLGHEPAIGRSFFVDHRKMRELAQAALAKLGESIDSRLPASALSVAQQQLVEIAKTLSHDVRILAMDEPSAALTVAELKNLFNVIRRLRSEGVGIIYISHRLEEIFEIGDRVTVLRDGRVVATAAVAEVDRNRLIQWMVGRELENEYPQRLAQHGREILRVKNLIAGNLQDINLTLHQGEILGLAGLVGAGRSELAHVIFAAQPREGGEIFLDGASIHPRSPAEAIALGLGLLTEDRNRQGLLMQMNVRENISLSNLRRLQRGLFLDQKKERRETEKFLTDLRIKTSGLEQAVEHLSGGNRQKVVLARWLYTQCRVLIFDEPTAGVDVGAKQEIYNLINELAQSGKGILVISSDLPELLGICDRIAVMQAGRITGILNREEFDQEKIMRLATGGEPHEPISFPTQQEMNGMTPTIEKTVAAAPLRKPSNRLMKALGAYGIGIALLLEAVIFALLSPYFFTADNLLNVTLQTSITAIIAVGMTLVILTAGIDLSVGALVAFCGVVATSVLQVDLAYAVALPLALVVGVMLGGFSGALAGVFITRFNITPFIVTLAFMTIWRGAAFMFTDGRPIWNLPEAFSSLGSGRVLGVPAPTLIMLAVYAVAYIVLSYTRFGRHVYAVGGNKEAARLAGININRIIVQVYMICGSLAALSGILLAARMNSGQPNAGLMYELDVIAAVVVGGASLFGGRGSIVGTFLGAMLIGVLRNGLNLLNVNSYVQMVVLGAVILLAVMLDQVRKK
ncbi:ATP-binding cassette domain-containing protein [candidate division KSB1 bacterium]|nr:ATP-binding cassette domain-containing protein [candidate division KSB1 bacterium]